MIKSIRKFYFLALKYEYQYESVEVFDGKITELGLMLIDMIIVLLVWWWNIKKKTRTRI